ncbi:ABC transporter substrate-binding protein [Catellatospora vulcania]|uniref:ABC transporter substrate-binding protein n=1 Tax=Catellatospora vulcania TaxID=1460450 RepID=UPI0012D3D10F|nr:ABC transporter substrate-binding protein [Catellatospora vulcania]
MSNGVHMDRRQLLRLSLLAAGATAAVPLVAGCGDDSDAATPTSRLRVGAADAINSTGLDPRTTSIGASLIVVRHVYDSLMMLENGEYVLRLAESVEPNAEATKWTIRIREGVKFHDGKPVTSADVAYSIRTLATPPSNRASVYSAVDLANIKVVDDRTVEVPLVAPRGDFRESTLVVFSIVFPDGTTDFAKAIGSGPYKLASNEETTVRLVANESYWGEKPKIAELEITRIRDASARLNALKAGQIDYAVAISATGAQTERHNSAIKIVRGGAANSNALSFAMNQRLAPFDDERVRRAVRLAVDRQALVDNALLGLGLPADDVVGKELPGYAQLATRSRDVAQARSLFQAAGVSKLTLRTSEIVPGMLNASKLFAQQLAEAGVTVELQQIPPDAYYTNLKALQTYPFQAFYYVNRPAAVHLAAVTHSKAPFNVTGTGEKYWASLAAAQANGDDKAREKAFEQLQTEFYESGGDVLWAYQEQLDASVPGVSGVRVSQSSQMFDQAVLR